LWQQIQRQWFKELEQTDKKKGSPALGTPLEPLKVTEQRRMLLQTPSTPSTQPSDQMTGVSSVRVDFKPLTIMVLKTYSFTTIIYSISKLLASWVTQSSDNFAGSSGSDPHSNR